MVNITVIGTGYVGLVSGACLAEFGNRVVCVDTDAAKIMTLKKGNIPIFEPGLEDVVERNVRAGRLSFSASLPDTIKGGGVVFIAVGTPPADDGSADLGFVEQAVRQVGSLIEDYTVFVDKSTVPVGTAQKVRRWVQDVLDTRGLTVPFDVVSNPEFLREGNAVYDFTHPDRVIIGSSSDKARSIMKDVYRALYLNETPYIETSCETAEMIKYASNAFLSVKISFINEIANLCEKVGANVKDVSRAMGRDGRIGPKFLHAGPGYGGSCFPKDTRAIAATGRQYGAPLSIIETAIQANERQKARMVDKIEQGLGGTGTLAGKTIAVLGLAFKQNTNDMRESPAIAICEGLVERGARLRVWDPQAMEEAAWRLNGIAGQLYFATDEYDTLTGSHALVLVTEWNQFRNLDLGRIKETLLGPCFFDLRDIYKQEEVEMAGLTYFGVGIP
ncbi:MAG: UDP-glucose/GDP-mannose dehydrogenase family protein [Treponema sp.]|jgi:UDPglucose 6-dehydrogenase|nr:UDP-glucose/GDP-mannose dehydrogenase family protein [Treponema sp.]